MDPAIAAGNSAWNPKAIAFTDGINVKQLMRSMNGSLSPQMAMEILVQTGEALAQVHRQGLLHRDVSPENIIIDRDGGMKLIDFGATRFFMGEKSRSLSVIIKPGFAPPEQYSSKGNQGAWTDIYALCATVWHTISGLQIPDAPSRIAQEPLPPLPAQVETECPGLIQILRKGLETDYRKRWKSVEEMLAAAGGPGVLGSEVSGSGMSGSGMSGSGMPGSGGSSGVPGSIGSSGGGSAVFGSAAAAPMKPLSGGDPYLQIYQNQAAGDKWMIPKQMQMRIGRSSDTCNIVIDDPNISRVHCIVHYDGKTGDFYLSDQSSNGTFADGQRLSSERVYTLAPGSFFELIPGRIAIKTGVE